MDYLFDTNIFISAKHEMPPRLWPTFWDVLGRIIKSGRAHSVSRVKDELYVWGDFVTDWIKQNAPKDFFIAPDNDVLDKYRDTQEWAKRQAYTEKALSDYASNADAYLVATAAAKSMKIVTYEKPAPEGRKRIKIPDACQELGVVCCGLNDVLEDLRLTI